MVTELAFLLVLAALYNPQVLCRDSEAQLPPNTMKRRALGLRQLSPPKASGAYSVALLNIII